MESGKWKGSNDVDVWPPCPRCGSSNTKFCYYNNYSLTQPRYFCKACRRYWTKGGSLRNVPIGGGCRKTRRTKSLRSQVAESTSFSAPQQTSTATNIDLAAVYANFVNHAPPPHVETISNLHDQREMINVPSIEFSNVHNIVPHQEMNGFFECQQFPVNNSMFPVGFDNDFMSMNIPMENDLLPPLPGEEALQTMWPNSDTVLMNSEQESIGGDVQVQPSEENSELINGSLSMFTGLNLEAIFRT